ncbi:conserved membrane hypothetical protein [uncultured Gammaproteobacteria bacterium]
MSESRSGKGKAAKKKGGGSMTLLMWLLLPVALFLAPTSMLVLVGMIPSMVAYITDSDEDKATTMIVGSLNFCGVLPFVILLWRKQHTLATAFQMISDPLTLVVMFGAAGAGWVLYFIIPPAVANFEASRAEARIEHLKNQKRDLIQEWGTEVIGEKEETAPARPAARSLG